MKEQKKSNAKEMTIAGKKPREPASTKWTTEISPAREAKLRAILIIITAVSHLNKEAASVKTANIKLKNLSEKASL